MRGRLFLCIALPAGRQAMRWGDNAYKTLGERRGHVEGLQR